MIQENPEFNDIRLCDSSLSWINNFDIFTNSIFTLSSWNCDEVFKKIVLIWENNIKHKKNLK